MERTKNVKIKGLSKMIQKEKMNKAANMLGLFMILFMNSAMVVCASGPAYAEKGGTYILDQLFWVGLVVLAVVLLKCLVSRNFTSAVVSGIVGGVLLVFIKNPKLLADMGEKISTIITSV